MCSSDLITPADKDENKSLASIKKILDYINLNYSQPLTAAELTALSNYSEYYFMKLFKQYTGKTLIAYINDLRIEKAKPMLLHSDSSGYGHGVGMSQWGANAMAKNGSNYEEILKHYYTGVEITNLELTE